MIHINAKTLDKKNSMLHRDVQDLSAAIDVTFFFIEKTQPCKLAQLVKPHDTSATTSRLVSVFPATNCAVWLLMRQAYIK